MSKHGKRAAGQTTVTIPMEVSLRDDLRHLATADDRTLAPYVRLQLKRHVEENRELLVALTKARAESTGLDTHALRFLSPAPGAEPSQKKRKLPPIPR